MEVALAGRRGGDRSRMPVTSSVPQRSLASGGLLRFGAAARFIVVAGFRSRVSGAFGRKPCLGYVFGIIPLVVGIAVRPLPLEEFGLKKLGFRTVFAAPGVVPLLGVLAEETPPSFSYYEACFWWRFRVAFGCCCFGGFVGVAFILVVVLLSPL